MTDMTFCSHKNSTADNHPDGNIYAENIQVAKNTPSLHHVSTCTSRRTLADQEAAAVSVPSERKISEGWKFLWDSEVKFGS